MCDYIGNYTSIERLLKIANSSKNIVKLDNIRVLDVVKRNSNGTLTRPKYLRYLHIPKLSQYPIDLNVLREKRKLGDSLFETRFLNIHVLEYFLMNSSSIVIEKSGVQIRTKIKTQLTTMLIIMNLWEDPNFPYFEINVSKFKNTIYLTHKQQNTDPYSDTLKLKLASICCSDSPNVEPDLRVNIDENNPLWYLFKAQLDQFEITYTAEVDAIKSNAEINHVSNMEELNKCNFVSLIFGRDSDSVTTYKYLHAYFTKVDEFYGAGITKKNFIENPLGAIPMTSSIANSEETIRKSVAVLHKFLIDVESYVSNVDCPYTVYQFSLSTINSKDLCYKIFNNKNENSFLNDEFIKFMDHNTSL